MATVLRVPVTNKAASLLPEDDAINVWHFWTEASDPTDAIGDINTMLSTFYGSIADIYCINTMLGNLFWDFYDLSDTPPRTVIGSGSATALPYTEGDGLPSECAVCMSFEGELSSGVNRARRRGRLYLGPLSNGTSSTVTGYVRVSNPTIDLIQAAAEELLDFDSIVATWCVFSPTAAGAAPWDEATLEAAKTLVNHGWIDNAFDTQRRRGTLPSGRVAFAIPE
jgi:hypothetical protein